MNLVDEELTLEKPIIPPLFKGMTAEDFAKKIWEVDSAGRIPRYFGDFGCSNVNRYAQEFVFTNSNREEYRITMLVNEQKDPFVMNLRDRESRRFPRQDLSSLVLNRRQEDYEMHIYPVLAYIEQREIDEYCRQVLDCTGMEFG